MVHRPREHRLVSSALHLRNNQRLVLLWDGGAGSLDSPRSMPALERPYRVWGYPAVPVVFAFICFVVIGNSLIQTPLASLAGLGFILAGIPLYYGWMAWGRRKSAP